MSSSVRFLTQIFLLFSCQRSFAFIGCWLSTHFPSCDVRGFPAHFPDFGRRHCRLVGLDGLEPSTSRLSGARSNHLSYRPFYSRVLIRITFPPSFSLVFRSLSIVRCPWASYSLSRLWEPVLPAGGDDGNRTHDPLLAGQVLSQLSYTPIRDLLLLSSQ